MLAWQGLRGSAWVAVLGWQCQQQSMSSERRVCGKPAMRPGWNPNSLLECCIHKRLHVLCDGARPRHAPEVVLVLPAQQYALHGILQQ